MLIVFNPNNGGNLFLQRLIGIKDFDVEITHARIGTGATAPTLADTDLEEPVAIDIPRASQLIVDNTAIIKFFIPNKDLDDDEYKEFGLYAGLQFMGRALLSPTYNKSTNEDATIECLIEYPTS